jgi:hypothetical protein
MKRREPPTSNPRAYRIGRLEVLIAIYGDLAELGPWPRELERLRAGEPFEVHGGQLPRESGKGPYGRYLVGSDGSVTPISRPPEPRRRRL